MCIPRSVNISSLSFDFGRLSLEVGVPPSSASWSGKLATQACGSFPGWFQLALLSKPFNRYLQRVGREQPNARCDVRCTVRPLWINRATGRLRQVRSAQLKANLYSKERTGARRRPCARPVQAKQLLEAGRIGH